MRQTRVDHMTTELRTSLLEFLRVCDLIGKGPQHGIRPLRHEEHTRRRGGRGDRPFGHRPQPGQRAEEGRLQPNILLRKRFHASRVWRQ